MLYNFHCLKELYEIHYTFIQKTSVTILDNLTKTNISHFAVNCTIGKSKAKKDKNF